MKLLWSILFLALPAFTQSTNATLSGTVLDPAGARVPNAQVMAENVNTRVVLTTMTNDTGVHVLRSEEHTSELQSLRHLVCRLLLEKKNSASSETSFITKQTSFNSFSPYS